VVGCLSDLRGEGQVMQPEDVAVGFMFFGLAIGGAFIGRFAYHFAKELKDKPDRFDIY